MATWEIEIGSRRERVESDNWLGALTGFMKLLDMNSLASVQIDVRPDQKVEIRDIVGNRTLLMVPISEPVQASIVVPPTATTDLLPQPPPIPAAPAAPQARTRAAAVRRMPRPYDAPPMAPMAPMAMSAQVPEPAHVAPLPPPSDPLPAPPVVPPKAPPEAAAVPSQKATPTPAVAPPTPTVPPAPASPPARPDYPRSQVTLAPEETDFDTHPAPPLKGEEPDILDLEIAPGEEHLLDFGPVAPPSPATKESPPLQVVAEPARAPSPGKSPPLQVVAEPSHAHVPTAPKEAPPAPPPDVHRWTPPVPAPTPTRAKPPIPQQQVAPPPDPPRWTPQAGSRDPAPQKPSVESGPVRWQPGGAKPPPPREPAPGMAPNSPRPVPPSDPDEWIFEQSGHINEAVDIPEAARRSLQVLLDAVCCEAGSVLYLPPRSESLAFIAAAGPTAQRLAGLRVPLHRGIAGFCCRSRCAMVVKDTSRDDQFMPDVDQFTGYRTRSILAAPLLYNGQPQTIHGCIELLNAPWGFEDWMLDMAQNVGFVLARYIQAARQRKAT